MTRPNRANDGRGLQKGTIEFRVRYAECDPMGVAHHAAFPVWLEMGRTELYRQAHGSYRDFEAEHGAHLAVVKLDIQYKAPVRYDDVLTLETTLVKMTRVKLVHAYRLSRDGVVLATGSTTLACVGGDGRVRPLPQSFRGD